MRRLLQLKGVKGRYQHSEDKGAPLQDVEFDVLENEFINILGPNGSGKSTLLKCIARDHRDGLERTGEISFLGVDIDDFSNEEWNGIVGRLYQSPSQGLALNLSPYANLVISDRKLAPLRLFGDIYSRKRKKQIEDRVNRLEEAIGSSFKFLWTAPRAIELSGGQKQMLALLCLFFQKPKLVLLDEPTSSLDDDRLKDFLVFLRHWVETENVSVLMVTHSGRVVLTEHTKIVNLDEGRVSSIQSKHEYQKSILQSGG